MIGKERYILAKRIARGGMAEIYLGKVVGEGGFERVVAIKKILPQYAQDHEFVQMFRDEANICKRLNHTNIVQVYSFEELGDSYALIMEYVDGADLRAILAACEKQDVRLSIPMAISIALEIAKGLHYAHTKIDEITQQPLEIVHRDVSPQNILISFTGEVKITDFGIADAENKITETKPGTVKGKYSYMSPEQVGAKPLDGRSDLFSLAIVLWEMLAMRRLFHADNEIQTIKLVQACRLPGSIKQFNPEIDDELEQILLKALSRDRNKRHATSGAFEKELSKYLHTHYAGFTASDLGNFINRMLADRKAETLDDIKQALSMPASSPNLFGASETGYMLGAASGFSMQQLGSLRGQNLGSMSIKNGVPGISQIRSNIALKAGHSKVKVPGAPTDPAPKLTLVRPTDMVIHSGPKLNSSHKSTLKLITFFGVIFGLFYLVYYYRNNVAPTVNIQVKTVPNFVKINVDGQDIDNGNYIRTPISIRLKEGSHKLKFTRQGYVPYVTDIVISPRSESSQEKYILKRNPKIALSPIKIVSFNSQEKITIIANDGFFIGETPTSLQDALYGKPLVLKLVKNGRSIGVCTILPTALKIAQPTVVTLGNPSELCNVKNP